MGVSGLAARWVCKLENEELGAQNPLHSGILYPTRIQSTVTYIAIPVLVSLTVEPRSGYSEVGAWNEINEENLKLTQIQQGSGP